MHMCAYYAHAYYAFVHAALGHAAFVDARIVIQGAAEAAAGRGSPIGKCRALGNYQLWSYMILGSYIIR